MSYNCSIQYVLTAAHKVLKSDILFLNSSQCSILPTTNTVFVPKSNQTLTTEVADQSHGLFWGWWPMACFKCSAKKNKGTKGWKERLWSTRILIFHIFLFMSYKKILSRQPSFYKISPHLQANAKTNKHADKHVRPVGGDKICSTSMICQYKRWKRQKCGKKERSDPCRLIMRHLSFKSHILSRFNEGVSLMSCCFSHCIYMNSSSSSTIQTNETFSD